MHPIVAHRERLWLYLAAWAGYGLLLGALVAFAGEASLGFSLALVVPLMLLLGLQALSSWYLVKLLPPGETPLPRLAGTWLGVVAASLGLWSAAALGWVRLLYGIAVWQPERGRGLTPLLLFGGGVGLLLTVVGQYLIAAFERSRQAERDALELRVSAREAELRFLRGQLDPHFLFNSLNSIAALIGTDPPAARRMCVLMSDFFRKSLRLGTRQSIPLADELAMAETFLAIEQVRFGERLRRRFEVAADVGAVSVPALVLQPLVENAVHHGIAHLLAGGEVTVSALRRGPLLELAVENPCDPERPPSRGAGVGLKNVRTRIETLFGERARVDVEQGTECFRVSILLPASSPQPQG